MVGLPELVPSGFLIGTEGHAVVAAGKRHLVQFFPGHLANLEVVVHAEQHGVGVFAGYVIDAQKPALVSQLSWHCVRWRRRDRGQ